VSWRSSSFSFSGPAATSASEEVADCPADLWLSVASESATDVCGISNEQALEVLDIVRNFGRRRELDTEVD